MTSAVGGVTDSRASVGTEPQRHLGHLIRRAQQMHAALWASEVSTTITSVQYGVLAVLERRPGISQKDLGEELSLDRSTIADTAKRMERDGMVVRSRGDDDRRLNALQCTPLGTQRRRALSPHVERVQELLVEELSREDVDVLRRILSVLVRSNPREKPE